MSQQPPTTDSQMGPELDLNLGEYLERLRRHWKLVVVLIAVSIAFYAVRYKMTPKVYEARARLQIKRVNVGSITGGAGLFMENWWNLEYYPTQYKLLESRGLAEQVVQDLRLQDDPKYNSRVAAGPDGEPTTAEHDEAQLGVIAQGLAGGLQVVPIRKTQLVDLIYRSSSPDFAAKVVNAFAEAFIEMGVTERTRTASRASTFLNDEIDKVNQRIAEGERQLQEFNRQQNMVDPDSNGSRSYLDSLNKDYASAIASRIEKEAAYRELTSKPKEALADSLSGGLVSDQRADLLRKEREYQAKLQTYKESWPEMVELKADIDQARRALTSLVDEQADQAIKSAFAALQTERRKENQLKRQIDQLTSTVIDEQSVAAEYASLQVGVDNDRKLRDTLLARQSETNVSANLQESRNSNVEIIERALVPRVPSLPSLKRNVSLGFLVGCLLSALAVFLLEFFDRTIKSTETAERLLRLPVLSVIPEMGAGGVYGRYYGYGPSSKSGTGKGKGWLDRRKGDEDASIELLPHTKPRLAVSEAYRSLRTALLLSSAERLKVVSVTSAETGEGKTTTATNLAVVLAQLGRQVLLIDADLRKPRMHKIFGLSNRVGLVNLLTGGGGVSQDVYQSTDVPNLYALTSGPIPPNPAELLASERMHALVRHVRESFEFVVIDTTPALAVTDATLVGSMADGVLLCLRAGKVQREDAKACTNRLSMADVRILGTVLNRYRAPSSRYGKHYRTYEAYAEPQDESEAAADSAA